MEEKLIWYCLKTKEGKYFNLKKRRLQDKLDHSCACNLQQAKWNQTYYSKHIFINNLKIIQLP